jgi:hypothetical protein
MKHAIVDRDDLAETERKMAMIFDQTVAPTQWKAEKWNGDRQFPGGYIIKNVLDSSGVAEIVAWAPQRDRAEQIVRRLNELEPRTTQNGS